MSMRIQFVERGGAPEKLIAEAEVLFEDGPFAGLKLVGFALWRGNDDQVFVTFPAKPFGAEGDRRYYDLLRSSEARAGDVRRVKEWIIETYRASRKAA